MRAGAACDLFLARVRERVTVSVEQTGAWPETAMLIQARRDEGRLCGMRFNSVCAQADGVRRREELSTSKSSIGMLNPTAATGQICVFSRVPLTGQIHSSLNSNFLK